MNKKETKKLLPAITHFADGGNLWRYNNRLKKWESQTTVEQFNKESNIIEDKHFEARKAYALGEEIEVNLTLRGITPWTSVKFPLWDDTHNYRPKLKKPIYEWQYNSYNNISNDWTLTREFFTDEPDCKGWIKFEPSRRIKK